VRTRTAYVLAGLTVLALAAVLSGVRPLTVAGGLPLALMLPGAALTAVLFRDPGRLAGVERVVLVPALGLGTLIAGGLLLWVVRVPLHRPAWALLCAGVTLAGLAAVVVRDRRRPVAGPASAAPGVRGRVRLPTGADATLVLPVFLDREGLFEPAPPDRRARLVRRVLPAVLAALALAGAVTVSLVTSIAAHDDRVTTLSVVPPGAADAGGRREVRVSATGLVAGAEAYTLVVTTPAGTQDTRTAVTPDEDGRWDRLLNLPAGQRLTVGLYRAGETTALRTVILAGAATG
jgi:hypothetical protein